MPLAAGSSRAVMSGNIAEMMRAGYPQRQAVAASLSNASRHPHAAGGGLIPATPMTHLMPVHGLPASHTTPLTSPAQGSPWWSRSAARESERPFHMAVGGLAMSQAAPWWERSEARQFDVPFQGGLIDSSVAGRTDRLPLSVASDAHIMPADVVSGLGQGNTLAGARIMNEALKIGPWDTPLPHAVHGSTIPHPPAAHGLAQGSPGLPQQGLAEGGATHGRVSILAAGGEVCVPEGRWLWHDDKEGRTYLMRGVTELGGGDTMRGHALLDKMIHRVREHTRRFLAHAPEPKK